MVRIPRDVGHSHNEATLPSIETLKCGTRKEVIDGDRSGRGFGGGRGKS